MPRCQPQQESFCLDAFNQTLEQVWDKAGGSKGLFRGTQACMIRDALFSAVCFPLYAYFLHQTELPPFVAGAMSGVIASIVATPPDFIKTRMLSQDEWVQQKSQTANTQRLPEPSYAQLQPTPQLAFVAVEHVHAMPAIVDFVVVMMLCRRKGRCHSS